MEKEKEFLKKEVIKKNPDKIKLKYIGNPAIKWHGIGEMKKGEIKEFLYDFGIRLANANPKNWVKE